MPEGPPADAIAKPRSESAREASRRNGARSRGPRSQAGKRMSSQNALKHGLRSKRVEILRTVPPALAALARELRDASGDNADALALVERILVAELSRQRAAELLSKTLKEILDPEDDMLAIIALLPGPIPNIKVRGMQVYKLIRRLIALDWSQCQRLMAYERRFRGQRDRALRQFSKLCEVGKS